jgi:hypothetical protein
MAPHPRPRQIDPYLPALRARWNAGEHHARALWREIRAQGDGAGEEHVRRVVTAWRAASSLPGAPTRTTTAISPPLPPDLPRRR